MTIRELYEWAVANNCENLPLYLVDDQYESYYNLIIDNFEINRENGEVIIS